MRSLTNRILIASLAAISLTIPVRAQMATMNEALTVGNNWINLIIQKKGSWGDVNTAVVQDIQEFKRGERTIGYFCNVKPVGYIVISLRKELAPVKAYSATCDLDPECERGLADLIKGKMEGVLDAVEQLVGPVESARTLDVQNILEINYRSSWEQLGGEVESFKMGLESGVVPMDYQGGDPPLLSSSWHQRPPYNNQCPDMACTWPCCDTPPVPYGCNNNALVGCVATAAAQIMRYWAWPPSVVYGYDWVNMLDRYVCDKPNSQFHDGNDNTCTQAQIDAVAELCHNVGVKVDMSYGCGGSSANHYDMWFAYVYYLRYGHFLLCIIQYRDDYSATAWFNRMKTQFNQNRPVHYGVEGHSLVADGWQIVGDEKQYHMNYGWGGDCNTPNGCNTWYTLDALHLGGLDVEDMIEEIYPAQALFDTLSGDYHPPSLPYRYFVQDATGESAWFLAGQKLQFLPGVTVKCTSTEGEYIRFVGTSSDNTRLFSIKGTQTGGIVAGIKIYNGGIRLYQNGSIRFH